MSNKKGKSKAQNSQSKRDLAVSKEAKTSQDPVKLPNVWLLTVATAKLIANNKKLLLGVTAIYGLLNLILVHGLASNVDVGSIKQELSQSGAGGTGSLATGIGVLAVIAGSSGGGSSQTAGTYQLVLVLMASLAIIWALRQIFGGSKVRIRDAYYRGMYPFVPFILVLLVIGLELIPLVIGSSLYTIVISNGIAVLAIEKILWAVLFGLFAFLSFYLVSASIFALYIVALPEMTPVKALRSANALVKNRRWSIMRKLLWIPLAFFVIAAIVMLPVIIVAAPIAPWMYFVLSILALLALHSYLYTLYRELLNE